MKENAKGMEFSNVIVDIGMNKEKYVTYTRLNKLIVAR